MKGKRISYSDPERAWNQKRNSTKPCRARAAEFSKKIRCQMSSLGTSRQLLQAQQWLVGAAARRAQGVSPGCFAGTSQMSKTMQPVARRGAPRLCPSALPAPTINPRADRRISQTATDQDGAQRSFLRQGQKSWNKGKQMPPIRTRQRTNSRPANRLTIAWPLGSERDPERLCPRSRSPFAKSPTAGAPTRLCKAPLPLWKTATRHDSARSCASNAVSADRTDCDPSNWELVPARLCYPASTAKSGRQL